MQSTYRGSNRGFTLVELLVVIAIIGMLVGLLLPAIQAARESARKVTCTNHLRQQGLALLSYHEINKQFPLGVADAPQGTYEETGYGWALALLPFIEQQALYDLVDPDWEPGPFHRKGKHLGIKHPGGDVPVEVFRCPSSPLPALSEGEFKDISSGYATNDYKACNGTGDLGMFFRAKDGKTAGSADLTPVEQRLSRGYWRVRIRDVTDGLSNTIALGESSYFYERHLKWPIWLGAPDYDESVMFKTGSKEIINCGIPNKTLAGFYGGLGVDDDCAFSGHAGGAYFAFADGKVRWLSESINMQVYSNLGTRNDENIVSEADW